MKYAVGYTRASTPSQVGEDKFGIDSQKQMILDYCAKHDMQIVKWFDDKGVSGAAKSRPKLDELLSGKDLDSSVSYVVVAKADRIARDIQLYYGFKYAFTQLGLEIISANEDWSAQDKLTATILEGFLAIVAEIEKENIRTRMSGGRRQKARLGGYAGGRAPMGYKVAGKKLVIEPREAKIVKRIYDLYAAGNDPTEIASQLKIEGAVGRSGVSIGVSTIRSVLNNERTYHGEYRYGKSGEWVKGQHEPILSGAFKEELRVNRMLEEVEGLIGARVGT